MIHLLSAHIKNMHEFPIVKKIVESAAEAAKKSNINNVKILRLRIGKMSGFEPGQLKFLFNTFEKDDSLKETKLDVEEIPVELECPECKNMYIDERFDDHEYAHTISHAPAAYEAPPCPKCGTNSPEIIHGRELDLTGLEGK